MATSTLFALVDTLVAELSTALPDVQVYDGFGISEDASDFLMVGVEDPNGSEATSADVAQEWHGLGAKSRLEAGTITCAALAWRGNPGDAGQGEARAAAAAIVAAVESHLRADPNLGGLVPGLMWVGFGTRLRLVQDQTDAGPYALVVFDIAFKSKI